jgi:uroporphyrinogen-III synthase
MSVFFSLESSAGVCVCACLRFNLCILFLSLSCCSLAVLRLHVDPDVQLTRLEDTPVVPCHFAVLLPLILYVVLCTRICVTLSCMSASILITAPEAYSRRFAQALEAHHLRPVAVPLIETVATSDTASMRSLLAHDLQDIDYVMFCSRCAIESFCAALAHKYGDAESATAGVSRIAEVVARCAFATIGKDGDYLAELLHVRPTVCPKEPSPSGIAAKLGEDAGAAGRTIAVLAPCVQEIEEPDVVPRFLAQLTELKMHVVRVDAYMTRPVSEATVAGAVKALLDGTVRGVAFTSSAEIIVLLRASPQCLTNTKVWCFGPYTGGFAAKQGIHVDCTATDFSSFDGFATAIEYHLTSTS